MVGGLDNICFSGFCSWDFLKNIVKTVIPFRIASVGKFLPMEQHIFLVAIFFL